MKKQNIIMLYGILGFVLFCGFLYGLGTYPLLDVDETRYVDMAKNMFHTKDYLTLYLNGDYFFEKPPLFFWIYKHLIVLNFILTIATFVMLCVGFFLSYDIYANFKPVQIVSLLVLIPFVICNWIFIIKRHKMKLFLSIVIFMTILSGFLTPYIYQFNYTFGENDLIKFAKIVRTQGFTNSTFKT